MGDTINMQQHRLERLVCLLLIVATLAVFQQLPEYDFVNIDDYYYVTENVHVTRGLTREGIIWAFTTLHANNWHPLTWLSHMLDCQLFGLKPGMHHLTNLLLHMANSTLLLLVLKRMTGALWRSAFAAALFALHPLHVESVAWVAERKDVLSTLFWLLTVWGYAGYVEYPGRNRYLLVLLFFALGLMAKPMLVTLPFILLLLDYWPLGRVKLWESREGGSGGIQRSSALHLVREKIPFFALTLASGIVTVVAQYKGGAVRSLNLLPLDVRIANALVSYVGYIGKMIWPQHLAIFYPHPGALPTWQVVGAGLLLLSLSIILLRAAGRFPYLGVGWLWYLGTLVPVIGLVQVGDQAMADRYTYVPLIGLFVLIAWGIPDLMARWRYRQIALTISAVIVVFCCTVSTWSHVKHWRNGTALFTHAVNVTADNALAHDGLGFALARQGRLDEAIAHYSEALRIKPGYAKARYNLEHALRHVDESPGVSRTSP